jgi:hypothetical protein
MKTQLTMAGWKIVLRKPVGSCCKDENPAYHGWVNPDRKSWNVGAEIVGVYINDFNSGQYPGN